MAKRRYTSEDIIRKLREVAAPCLTVPDEADLQSVNLPLLEVAWWEALVCVQLRALLSDHLSQILRAFPGRWLRLFPFAASRGNPERRER